MTIHDNIIPAIDWVDFVRLVDDLVNSDPGQWGPIVAKHLEDCPPCLVYLQQMLDLKVLLNHVFEGEKLNEEHITGVLNALNNFREGQHGWRSTRRRRNEKGKCRR